MESVWYDKSEIAGFPQLEKDISTDVLIIGGGIAGVLIAYMLSKKNINYVLLEADTVCSKTTKNTTAKITSQHGLIYDKLIREFDVDTARLYLEANEAALKKYRRLAKNIDCDFENTDSYVYTLDKPRKIEKELAALSKIGFAAEYCEQLSLPFSTMGAVKFPNQAQFNPLKFISAISENLNIYEHTPVLELTEHTARTGRAVVTASKIVVATHFPFINKHGSYYLKMYQQRSYVLALENAQDVDGMYVDENEKGMSFRNYGELLLVGGGGHRTGKKGGCWETLEVLSSRYYPGAHEKYRWATQDCMTLDKVPYIGHYSEKTPDFYVTTGFNKWGMTTAMLSAEILTTLLEGKENRYADAFLPSRTIMRPQLAVNAFEAVTNLLTISKKRCPHLGCALKWNRYEHSWDCPCHGSRFTRDGKLLDNPATGDLK